MEECNEGMRSECITHVAVLKNGGDDWSINGAWAGLLETGWKRVWCTVRCDGRSADVMCEVWQAKTKHTLTPHTHHTHTHTHTHHTHHTHTTHTHTHTCTRTHTHTDTHTHTTHTHTDTHTHTCTHTHTHTHTQGLDFIILTQTILMREHWF